MNKWRKYAGFAVLIIIALVFVQAGLLKLLGVQAMVEVFHKLGYPGWFRITVGIFEIVGAIMLLTRKYRGFGAMVLMVVLIGAFTSSLISGQAGGAALPFVLFCILVWIVLISKRVNQHKKENRVLENKV